jgi:hypothetical protein
MGRARLRITLSHAKMNEVSAAPISFMRICNNGAHGCGGGIQEIATECLAGIELYE